MMHIAHGRIYIASCPTGIQARSLLLNIHICDLFYFLEDLDIASNADDTTICTVNEKKSQSLVHYKHLHHCTLDGLTANS